MSNVQDDSSSTIDLKGLPKDPNLVDTVAGHGAPAAGGLQPGSALGSRYTILKILGRGGMGIVYQAWDAELGVPVAIKMILPHREIDEPMREAAEARFKRELLLARSVTHRNVVRIHDLGEVDGRKYITMPYVEGETLAALMRRTGPMPVTQALMLARQIADGLSAAHDVGVVHRDLKPENVMVTAEGEALILDFGIARAYAAGATQSGVVMGTLEYMAPEQAGGAPADHRTDIYAFGLILYDMLVGRQRLSGIETPMSELLERARHAPPSPRTLRRDLPEQLDRIVVNCIQPEANARFDTTAALNVALSQVTTQLMPATSAARQRGSRRLWIAAAAALAALTLGVAGWTYWPPRIAPATLASRPPMSVLVASLENQTGDPVMGELAELALGIGIESSSFINVMPRVAVRTAAGLAPNAILDTAGAKRLALNEGVDVVLSGRIEPARGGYRLRIVAEAGKVIDGAPLFDFQRELPPDDRLLVALGQLAAEIRAAFGDQEAQPTRIRANEALSFSSLQSARGYVAALQHVRLGQPDAALAQLTRLTADDPSSARAWILLSLLLNTTPDEHEQAHKTAMANMATLTEREQLRLRAADAVRSQDPAAAIHLYESLLSRFPGDPSALSNLALAAFNQRDFAKATTLGETSARLFSNNPLRRNNVALFAMYSGDFLAAQRHAQQAMSLRPSFEKAAMTWALSSAAAGAYDEARAGYERIYALSSLGRFFSTAGLSDLALLRGRPADAVLALGRAMAAEASSDESRARLTVTLAEARMAQGRAADGADLAIAAAQLSDSPAVRYLALSVLLAAGRQPEAARIAALPLPAGSEMRMMLKLMDGEVQLAKGNPTEALTRFREAVTFADSWLARLALGRAYLATGALADAQIEFDQCLKRRGEATAVFLDDIPTLRMLAPVYYYQGVARSALKLSSAAESFRTFLAFKDGGDEKSLIDDARKRLREDR